MTGKFYYTITPTQFLSAANVKFSKQGNWLSFEICPFCGGGLHGDTKTFAVHRLDGSFGCLRSSCSAHGTFFDLFKTFGVNPVEYFDHDRMQNTSAISQNKYQPFVYGQSAER